MKRNKRLIVIAIAILGVFTITTSVFSQNCCNKSMRSVNSNAGWWNYNTPSEYALTSDQISKITSIREESNKKSLPLDNELRILRNDYRIENSKADLDVKKVKSLRNDIRNHEEKIEDINLDTRVQIKKILNKKQLEYFNNDQYSWWDMAENCWYTGDMNMRSGSKHMMSANRGCW